MKAVYSCGVVGVAIAPWRVLVFALASAIESFTELARRPA